jgi:hypothetical protein
MFLAFEKEKERQRQVDELNSHSKLMATQRHGAAAVGG